MAIWRKEFGKEQDVSIELDGNMSYCMAAKSQSQRAALRQMIASSWLAASSCLATMSWMAALSWLAASSLLIVLSWMAASRLGGSVELNK